MQQTPYKLIKLGKQYFKMMYTPNKHIKIYNNSDNAKCNGNDEKDCLMFFLNVRIGLTIV